MITNSEIASLMGAVSRSEISLRDEILQIVSASAVPMCCKDIYGKSVIAPDTMTLSMEVHRMAVKAGLLEVAEKKERTGFRAVGFYRLTDRGRERLRTPGAEMRESETDTHKPVIEIRKTETNTHKPVIEIRKTETNIHKPVIDIRKTETKVKPIASISADQKKEELVTVQTLNYGAKAGELNRAIYKQNRRTPRHHSGCAYQACAA